MTTSSELATPESFTIDRNEKTMENKVILVVAPNAKMLAVACRLGASLGLEYITCEHITKAIDLLKRVRVDLIAVEAFIQAEREDDVFSLIKAVRALPKRLQKPIWVFAAEPGPIGTQLAPLVAVTARLLGADRFFVAHLADIPRLVAETRTALD
jgi:CheY-like chemotaxis protein